MHVVVLSTGFACLSLLASCVTSPSIFPAGEICTANSFSVSDDFDGARRGRCTVQSDVQVQLQIIREDDDVINPSPWFAFRLTPVHPTMATVEIGYADWEHRYVPKISTDGTSWRPLDAQFVQVSNDRHRLRLQIPLVDEPVWVAAQELVTNDVNDAWYRPIADDSEATISELGRSLGGRPIVKLENNTAAKDVILLVGRQHPPEVSGSFAMRSFVETLFSNSELAGEFRRRFRIIAIPMMNPDGVAAGNWRHNAAGVDLNRDWGPFTQPETRHIAALLDYLDAADLEVRVFIDFHSTNRNLFYTQIAEDITAPPDFSKTWFARARPRLGDYLFDNEARETSDTANGKNYMYKRYGVPSMTYEVGDETDRQLVVDSAGIFAEEFMRLLSETL